MQEAEITSTPPRHSLLASVALNCNFLLEKLQSCLPLGSSLGCQYLPNPFRIFMMQRHFGQCMKPSLTDFAVPFAKRSNFLMVNVDIQMANRDPCYPWLKPHKLFPSATGWETTFIFIHHSPCLFFAMLHCFHRSQRFHLKSRHHCASSSIGLDLKLRSSSNSYTFAWPEIEFHHHLIQR